MLNYLIRPYLHQKDYAIISGLLHKFEEEVEFKRTINQVEKTKVQSHIDSFLTGMRKPYEDCLVILNDDDIIGFKTYNIHRSSPCEEIRAGDFEFAKAYIEPEFRGKNIGYNVDRYLLEMVKNNKSVFDIKRAISIIEDSQKANILNKKKLGFKPVYSTRNLDERTGREYMLYARKV